MAKSDLVYVMNERIMARLITRRENHKVCCRICGKEIQVGDKVLMKRSSNLSRYFHYSCFKNSLV